MQQVTKNTATCEEASQKISVIESTLQKGIRDLEFANTDITENLNNFQRKLDSQFGDFQNACSVSIEDLQRQKEDDYNKFKTELTAVRDEVYQTVSA